MKINYFGMVKSVMSWANVGRETVLALDSLGCDVSVTNCRGHLYNGGLNVGERILRLMEKRKNTEIEITFEYPLNYDRLTGKKKIGLLVYESTVLPKLWVENIKRHLDILVVPSRFCKKIMIENGIPDEMVRVAPYGYDPLRFSSDAQPRRFDTKKKFIFLTIAMPHLRKGLDVLVSAFTEEFSSSDDAALVIKTSYLPFKNRKPWETDPEEIIRKSRTARDDSPEIIFINKEESPEKIPGYFAACDCYVQPSLSEGFGIAILEAMAMKKAVITTGWGGQKDFCDADNSFLIDYALAPAGAAQYDCESADALVAHPDKIHLRRLMRAVYEDRAKAAAVAEKGYHSVRNLTWENSARKLIEIMRNETSPSPHPSPSRGEGVGGVKDCQSKNMNAIEISNAIQKMKKFSACSNEDIAAVLNIPPSEKVIADYLSLQALDGALKRAIAANEITPAHGFIIAKLGAADRKAFSKLFDKTIRPNINETKEIIQHLEDLKISLSKKSFEEILNMAHIAEILKDEKLNQREKVERLRDALKRFRYPMITEKERIYKEKIKELGLPNSVSVSHPKYFEGNDLKFEFRIKKIEELKEILEKLSHKSDQIEKILDFIKE